MPEVILRALVKDVRNKSLASLDKGFEIKLQGDGKAHLAALENLVGAPSDAEVEVKITW